VLPWARELEAIFQASDVAKDVQASIEVDPPALSMEADPDLLCQVLINLLRNGAEAAKAHGAEPRVAMKIQLLATGEVQIDVADNGAGVPDNLKQDVFLPFFTTKASGTGRRPEPRPPSRAGAPRIDRGSGCRWRRRPLPDRDLKVIDFSCPKRSSISLIAIQKLRPPRRPAQGSLPAGCPPAARPWAAGRQG
jgi:hypothetical protein